MNRFYGKFEMCCSLHNSFSENNEDKACINRHINTAKIVFLVSIFRLVVHYIYLYIPFKTLRARFGHNLMKAPMGVEIY